MPPSRTGAASFAAYQPLVNSAANWTINAGGDGTSVVPDTTVFAPVPEPEICALMLAAWPPSACRCRAAPEPAAWPPDPCPAAGPGLVGRA